MRSIQQSRFLKKPKARIALETFIQQNKLSTVSGSVMQGYEWLTETHFSKNSCRPFILFSTWSGFLKLKKGFQGGNLGKSLHTEISLQPTNYMNYSI